jgi:hypothetical protein
MMKVIYIPLIFLLSMPLLAQDTSPDPSDTSIDPTEVVEEIPEPLFPVVVQGLTITHQGETISEAEMKELFALHPTALETYNEGRGYQFASGLIMVPTLGFAAAQMFNSLEGNDDATMGVIAGIGLVGFIVTGILGTNLQYQALEDYNTMVAEQGTP